MSAPSLVVRAVDVGYGHIKFTDGRDPSSGTIRTDSIPSQSPAYKGEIVAGAGVVMSKRDTFVIPVGDRMFEVGRDVGLALSSNQETERLDERYCLSDEYAARLFGAINYMYPNLPANVIDVLVLGLPLNTYPKYQQELAQRFTGKFVINNHGEEIIIRACHVYPQPMGGYMTYLGSVESKARKPLALIVDPGYNTVDYFCCQGMQPSNSDYGAVQLGMSAVMKMIASDIIKKHDFDAPIAQVVRRLDRSLTTGTAFEMYGNEYDLVPHMAAGNEVIEEAANAVKNKINAGGDIDVIIVSGGGASLYAPALQTRFPKHKLVILQNQAVANVRGFHMIGELLARSLEQAMKLRESVPA